MKKLFLVSAAAVLLAGCANSNSVISQQDIAGQWVCGIEYPDSDISTMDAIKLNADSTFTDNGLIFAPAKRPIFRYSDKTKGTWKLENNELVFHFSDRKVAREHHPKVTEGLTKDKQAKVVEERLFKALSGTELKDITLKLLDYDNEKLTIKQTFTDSEKFYIGACKRYEEK